MWNYLKNTPVIFPITAIFFIILSIFDASIWIGDRREDWVYWLKPMVIFGYTILWIFTSFRMKWAATGFVIYSIVHLILYLFYKENETLHRILENTMVTPIPFALIFSAFVLFYYRGMK